LVNLERLDAARKKIKKNINLKIKTPA